MAHVQNRRVAFQGVPPRRPQDGMPGGGYSDFSSDEDEEERRIREEEEEERALSRRHGEAGEAPSTKKKRDSEKTDEELQAEYARRAKKKPRPTLTLQDLMGNKGLVRIKNEFASLVYPRKSNSIDAAASYSSALIRKYKNFCYDLFPSMAFEDTLTKIESFGSKKEIKSYLQTMRDDVRKRHLEGIYGKEKAERMLRELEYGMKQQQDSILDSMEEVESVPPMENPYNMRSSNTAPAGSEDDLHVGTQGASSDSSETELHKAEEQDDSMEEIMVNDGVEKSNNDEGSDQAEASPKAADENVPKTSKEPLAESSVKDESSDEEEEAKFLDIVGKAGTAETSDDNDKVEEPVAATDGDSRTIGNGETTESSFNIPSDTLKDSEVHKHPKPSIDPFHDVENNDKATGAYADSIDSGCIVESTEKEQPVTTKNQDGDKVPLKDDAVEAPVSPQSDADKAASQIGVVVEESQAKTMTGLTKDSDEIASVAPTIVAKASSETGVAVQSNTMTGLTADSEEVATIAPTMSTEASLADIRLTAESNETATIVPTMSSEISPVERGLSAASDETATIVPTMSTQASSQRDIGLIDESDETATIVPTLSETQSAPTQTAPSEDEHVSQTVESSTVIETVTHEASTSVDSM